MSFTRALGVAAAVAMPLMPSPAPAEREPIPPIETGLNIPGIGEIDTLGQYQDDRMPGIIWLDGEPVLGEEGDAVVSELVNAGLRDKATVEGWGICALEATLGQNVAEAQLGAIADFPHNRPMPERPGREEADLLRATELIARADAFAEAAEIAGAADTPCAAEINTNYARVENVDHALLVPEDRVLYPVQPLEEMLFDGTCPDDMARLEELVRKRPIDTDLSKGIGTLTEREKVFDVERFRAARLLLVASGVYCDNPRFPVY